MNREIKFRVWNKTIKYFVRDLDGGIAAFTILGLSEYLYRNSIVNVDDFVFLQFTGLKDKNGKEIYEGDIISQKCYEDWTDTEGFEFIGVVRYKHFETDFGFYTAGYCLYTSDVEGHCGMVIKKECVIIGNEFENGNLL